MISLTSNVSALKIQNELRDVNLQINTALERLATGYRINSAKDDAAGNAISTKMESSISALEIAEQNISMGIDLLDTASSNLELINEHLERLRDLAVQAQNGTYSETSLEAINMEAKSRYDEVMRLINSTEYNGVNLYESELRTEVRTVGAEQESSSELFVNAETVASEAHLFSCFVNFDAGPKTVNLLDKSGSVIDNMTFYDTDKIKDLLDFARSNGMEAKITDGVINIDSDEGLYLADADANGLLEQLGISNLSIGTETITVGASVTSSTEIDCMLTSVAEGTSSLGDIVTFSGSKTIDVKDFTGVIASSSFDENSTIDDILTFLNSNGMDAGVNNGVLTIESTQGRWAEDADTGGILELLGVGQTSTSTTVTIGQEVTSDTAMTFQTVVTADGTAKLGEVTGLSGTKNVVIKDGAGDVVSTQAFTAESTIDDLLTFMNDNDMIASISDGVISISSTVGNIVADETPTGYVEALGITVGSSRESKTVGVATTSSAKITYSTYKITTGTCQSSDLLWFADLSSRNPELRIGINTGINQWWFSTWGEPVDGYITLEDVAKEIKEEYQIFLEERGNSIQTMEVSFTDGKFKGSYVYWDSSIDSYSTATIPSCCIQIVEWDDYDHTYNFANTYYHTEYFFETNFSSTRTLLTTATAKTSTKLNVLNITSSQKITVVNNGTETVLTFTTASTLGSITSQLTSAGLSANFSSGKLSVTESNTAYIKGMTSSLKSILKLSSANFSTITEITTYTNSNAGLTHSVDTSSTIEDATTLAQLGIISDVTITIVRNGTITTLTFSSTSTFAEIQAAVNALDITTNLADGKVTFTGSGSAYIAGMNSNLKNALNITSAFNTTITTTTAINTPSNQMSASTTGTIVGGATAGSAGLTNDKEIVVNKNGTIQTITIKPTDTIDNIFSKLDSVGLNSSLTDGKLTISGNGNSYIESVDSELENVLGLSGTYYTTGEYELFENTDSSRLMFTDNRLAQSGDSLALLGITGAQTIVVKKRNGEATISLSETDTIKDLVNNLRAKDIKASFSLGKLVLDTSINSYIQSMPSDLQNALKLTAPLFEEKEIVVGADPKITRLQIGRNGDAYSILEVDTAFAVVGLDELIDAGLESESALEKLSDMLSSVYQKQAKFGAYINRLESALEANHVEKESLISSLSTMKDADIAEVTTEFLSLQIRQSACQSLLSTANQAPNIAVTLISGSANSGIGIYGVDAQTATAAALRNSIW